MFTFYNSIWARFGVDSRLKSRAHIVEISCSQATESTAPSTARHAMSCLAITGHTTMPHCPTTQGCIEIEMVSTELLLLSRSVHWVNMEHDQHRAGIRCVYRIPNDNIQFPLFIWINIKMLHRTTTVWWEYDTSSSGTEIRPWCIKGSSGRTRYQPSMSYKCLSINRFIRIH